MTFAYGDSLAAVISSIITGTNIVEVEVRLSISIGYYMVSVMWVDLQVAVIG